MLALLAAGLATAVAQERPSRLPSLRFETSVSIDVGQIAELLPFLAGGRGRVEFTGDIEARGETLRYKGRIAGAGLTWEGYPPVAVQAHVEGDRQRLRVTGLVLDVPGGRLEGEAVVSPSGGDASTVSLRWRDLDLRPLSAIFEKLPFIAAAASDGRLEASWTAPAVAAAHGSLTASFRPLPASEPGRDGRPALPLAGEIEARGAETGLEIARASLRVAGVRLALAGRVRRDGRLSGRYDLAIPDAAATLRAVRDLPFPLPEALSRPPADEIAGRLEAAGTFAGTAAAPVFAANATGSLRAGALGIDALAAALRFEAGRVVLQSLRAEAGRGRLEGDGRFLVQARGRQPGPEDRIALALTDLDIESLAPLLPARFAVGAGGRLDAKLVLSGTADRLEASGSIAAAAVRLAGVTLDRFEAEGRRTADGAIEIDRLTLAAGEDAVTGRLRLDAKMAGLEASLHADGFDLARLAPLLPEGTPLEGRVSFDLTAAGPLRSPAFDVDLRGRDLALRGVRAAVLDLVAKSDGRTAEATVTTGDLGLRAEARFNFEEPLLLTGTITADRLPLGAFIRPGAAGETAVTLPLTLEAAFSYPLREPGGFQARLSFSGLDLAAVAGASGDPRLQGLTGEIAARAEASGNPRDPAALRVSGEIGTFAAALRGIEVAAAAPLRFSLENGDLLLGDIGLAAGTSTVRLAGVVRDLAAARRLDLRLEADLDASLVPPDVFEGDLAGRLTLQVAATGPLAKPRLEGTGAFSGGYVGLAQIPLVLSNLAAKLEFRDDAVIVSDGLGAANGGYLSYSGQAALGGEPFGLTGARLDVRAGGVRLEYPPGLVTVSSVDGSVSSEDGRTWLVGGNVEILRGSFRENVYPGAEILGFSSLPLPPPAGPETPPFYENWRLELSVRSQQPLLVRNNIADLALAADLRVRGTLAEPRLDGRVWNAGVGSLVVNEREFTVERVEVAYADRPPSAPDVEVLAHTELAIEGSEHDITLRLSGTPPDLEVNLTSSPAASREELAFALLTGRSLRALEGAALNTLGNQLVTWFAAPLASPVTRALERFLGVERIALEPLHVASEEDPGARLTLYKRITNRASATYSLDITSSQGQIWIVDYELARNFSLRGIREEDGSFGGSLRHGFSLFGPPSRRPGTAGAAAAEQVSAVEVAGDLGPPAEEVRRRLEAAWRGGRVSTVAHVGRLADDLQDFYRSRDFHNATVLTRLEEAAGAPRAVFEIQAGRPVRFVFRGDALPRRLEREVRSEWTGQMPESANVEAARETILAELRRRRHHAAAVEASIAREGGATAYTFTVAAGPRYAIRTFEVRGNEAVPDRVIREAVANIPTAAGAGLWTLVNEPRLATRAVEIAYENLGFRRVEVAAPEVSADPGQRSLTVVLNVVEGPRSLIRAVEFTGTAAFPEAELRVRAGLAPGDPFSPAAIREARLALLEAYREAGYQEAEIGVETRAEPDDPGTAVVFAVSEGPRHTLDSIEVAAGSRTSAAFVRRTAGLKSGQPLSLQDLARARSRLFETGVFQDIEMRGEALAGGRERVTVTVRPEPPVKVNYGLRYNTVNGFEGIGQIELINLLGGGRRGLFAFRTNTRERDLRFSLISPYLFGARLNLLATAASTREVRDLFTTEERRLSAGARVSLPLSFSLSGLYRVRRIHIFEAEPIGPFPFDFMMDLAELSSQLIRDARDDRFDPRRGTFLSLSATYAPGFLGTELRYLSTYSQLFFYVPFGRGLVWASSWQTGLAWAFDDQILISALRFFAGGAYSLRGFRHDEVGPRGFSGPEGGEAVLLTSQELRFPIFRGLRGAVFFDAGNVYETVRDMVVSDLRTGLGAGLRYSSPIGVLRVDLGFNLSPRDGEPRAVAYFSLGQAF